MRRGDGERTSVYFDTWDISITIHSPRCFWINLYASIVYCRYLTPDQCPRPIGVIAGIIIFSFLNLNPHQGMTLQQQQHMNQFDFPGLALLMSGVVCILIGLNNGETSCAFGLCDSIY